jgi:hypothetical protein
VIQRGEEMRFQGIYNSRLVRFSKQKEVFFVFWTH